MSLSDEIKARVRRAKAKDKTIRLSDFQVRAAEKGVALINLKTSKAELIFDDTDPFAPDEDIAQ
jgi:hypothetical protein